MLPPSRLSFHLLRRSVCLSSSLSAYLRPGRSAGAEQAVPDSLPPLVCEAGVLRAAGPRPSSGLSVARSPRHQSHPTRRDCGTSFSDPLPVQLRDECVPGRARV
eukprot:1998634-Rhodomonas_salina.1